MKTLKQVGWHYLCYPKNGSNEDGFEGLSIQHPSTLPQPDLRYSPELAYKNIKAVFIQED